MAIGWLTVLKSVPWSDVVSNAPKVAAGAKKLWNAAGAKPPAAPNAAPLAQTALLPEAQAVAALAARIGLLETAAAELKSQMAASSELITSLAEQNTQLILRIETQRRRLRWLGGGLAVARGLLGAALALVLRHWA